MSADFPPEPNGSSLCAGCGMCCDGTLFDQAKAGAAEIPGLQARGFATFETEGKLRFRLPCHALEGACCTIYAERPGTCRSFRCALLRRYEAGEVDLDEAQRTVRTAKQLLERLVARRPEGRHVKARRKLARDMQRAIEAKNAPGDTAQAYLDVMALEYLLVARFKNRKIADSEAR